MRKLYEKNGILFAVLWILVYCFATIPIRGKLGDESIWMTIVLLIIAVGITVFVKINHLEKKYGLTGWPRNTKRYLFFIPMWILVTGNLWGGLGIAYDGMGQVFAVISMLLIGYVEEVIFRGFLFKALIPKDGIKLAIIISSVTFGIGHIINLFAGQASLETVIQVFFAVA
jgi:membrane protease YdiL (CAAX protease family)